MCFDISKNKGDKMKEIISMAETRRQLFETITSLKKDEISYENADMVHKLCHDIIDSYRVEIKGCEVAGELKNNGIGYTEAVVQLG